MYGWPYFLFQIYSYSFNHLAAIISDPATNQYCPPYISQGFTVVTGGITKYLDFYCSFYSSLCNFETFKSSHCSITYLEGVNARKIVFANSAGHGSHWTIINSLLPLSLLLLQPAAAQIQCGSHGTWTPWTPFIFTSPLGRDWAWHQPRQCSLLLYLSKNFQVSESRDVLGS